MYKKCKGFVGSLRAIILAIANAKDVPLDAVSYLSGQNVIMKYVERAAKCMKRDFHHGPIGESGLSI